MLLAPLQMSSDARIGPSSKYTALFAVVLQISDIGIVAFAGWAAHWLRFREPMMLDDARSVAIGIILAALVFGSSPAYRNWRSIGFIADMVRVVRMWSIAFTATVVLAVALKFANELSRIWWVLWYLGVLGGIVGMRIICRRLAIHLRESGIDLRSAVVVGGTPLAGRIIDTFKRESWAGIEVRGWFTTLENDAPVEAVLAPSSSVCLGNLEGLAEYVESHHVNEVWLALPLSEQAKIDEILWSLRHATADIKLVPDLFGLRLLNQSIGQVAGLPVISLQQSPIYGYSRFLKAVEDRVLSLVILIAISPLLLLLAVAVKMSSPGPVFYRQERVSWNNRKFKMLKFRSMPVDAETKTGAIWAAAGENRATKIGSILRKTSLDELPQFINVLFGEMSIVGPRPERPVFVERFKDEIPNYMKKHMVKAGITGWAQINGWRGSTDLKRRIECDMYYVENWSLALDLKIILLTFAKGFVHKNAY